MVNEKTEGMEKALERIRPTKGLWVPEDQSLLGNVLPVHALLKLRVTPVYCFAPLMVYTNGQWNPHTDGRISIWDLFTIKAKEPAVLVKFLRRCSWLGESLKEVLSARRKVAAGICPILDSDMISCARLAFQVDHI